MLQKLYEKFHKFSIRSVEFPLKVRISALSFMYQKSYTIEKLLETIL